MPNRNEVIRKLQATPQHRELRIDREHINEEARTVDLAFSSEAPVERFFGMEILDHDPKSVRLERLNDGAALLIDHRNSIESQVGVVESARIEKDRVGRAVVRFSGRPLAEDVFNDVRDGIVSKVSIAYQIHKVEITEGKGNAPDEARVTDWEPLEISFVAVPADATVGVGRAADSTTPNDGGNAMSGKTGTAPDNKARAKDDPAPDPKGTDAGHRDDPTPEPAPARKAEPEDRTKTDERIRALGKQFKQDDLAEQYIELNSTVDQFEDALRSMITQPKPVPAVRDIDITGGGPVHGSLRLRRALPHVPEERLERQLYIGGQWIRGTLFGDPVAARWCREHLGQRAMAEGVQSKGGALVPEEFASMIIDLREKYGVMRRLCRRWPMTSDTLTIPRRTGSTTGYWVGENTAPTQSNPTFDSITLVARKLAFLTLVPTELMEDSVIDLADFLAFDFGEQSAQSEDDAWLNGDGTSTYGGIEGVRTKLVDGNHTVGAQDATAGDNTLPEIVAGDLDIVRGILPEFAEMNAVWLCSKLAKNLVFDAITRAAGGNTMETLGEKPVPAYLGDEIVTSQKMPNSATADYENTAMLLYGDFMKACAFGDRRDIRVQVLTERYSDADQVGLKATERVDIVTHDLGDTSVAGPVVGLIGN